MSQYSRGKTCAADPTQKRQVERRYWFLNNYYRSYSSVKGQYPWPSLGYTFDWERKDQGEDLIRFGESEFVIPANTPIKFESATDTLTYCTPK